MKKIANLFGLFLIHLSNLPLLFLLFVTGQNKEMDRLLNIRFVLKSMKKYQDISKVFKCKDEVLYTFLVKTFYFALSVTCFG